MSARRLLLLVALTPLLGGCDTARFYSQAVSGHLELMRRAVPIEEQLGGDALSPELKARLQAALRIREFASRELALPDNGSYKRYADLGRQYVLWNVFATPEFSLEPVTSCFVFAGCVSYRGYFHEADARAEAAALRAQGYDVHVGGVPAYSTLGWFDDPVLNTFIQYPESALARLMFHELAHQLLYVKNDTRFNESFATTVEQAGVERWLAKRGSGAERAAHERSQVMRNAFLALILKYRTALASDYRQDLPPQVKRLGKERVLAQMDDEYRQLKASWGGFSGYDRWFAGKPNNATLASVSLYTEWVPALRALLEREDGDLQRFYAAAKELGKLPRDERDARLREVLQSPGLEPPGAARIDRGPR